MKPTQPKCYACDQPAAGHALRDADGGCARGDDTPTTVAVPACMRHAWDPVSHPALDRLAPRPPLRLHPSTITSAIEFGWPTPETPRHRHSDKPQGALFAIAVRQLRRTVGVAIIGRPVAQALQDGVTAEVTRLCTGEDKPTAEHATGKQSRRDACSLLYGAARRAALALGYRRLITYTLTTESGASLRGAGWEPTATVKGADWDRPGRRRKQQEHLDRIRWEAVL
jgi:hypothetical protein